MVYNVTVTQKPYLMKYLAAPLGEVASAVYAEVGGVIY